MKTITINKSEVPTIIKNIADGHVFTVTFIKKNGEVREMNCRKGVTSYLTPPELKKREKPEMPSNIVTVFDMKNNAYRHINVDTTLTIKAEKRVYEVK